MKKNTRAIYLFCILVVVVGIFLRILPTETQIAQTNARAQTLLEQAMSNERALRDEPRMLLLARRIREDLSGLHLRSSDQEDINQALLRDIQATAARNHLLIISVKPTGPIEAVPTMPSGSAPLIQAARTPEDPLTDPKRSRDLDVSVRGSYYDIARFLRDLSHMPTLTRVLTVQLDRTNGGAATSPSLDASAHIRTIALDRSIIS